MTSVRTRLGGACVAVAAMATACGGGSGPGSVGVSSPSPTQEATARAPVPGNPYLFGRTRPAVAIQAASTKLVRAMDGRPVQGLHAAALQSTPGSAAVFLVEDDPAVPWGTHLAQGESEVFRSFAGDGSLGPWLIVLTDVVVHGTADPINPTAYRWDRADVERYVACGIPAGGTSDCKTAFFRAAAVAIIVNGRVQRSQ